MRAFWKPAFVYIIAICVTCQVSAAFNSRCPAGCLTHGTCNEELGRCDCPRDYTGPSCSERVQPALLLERCQQVHYLNVSECLSSKNPCLNACNGRGKCRGGFCHCKPGFYGTDCSLSLHPVTGQPELLASQGYSTRQKRPWVYVYDLPSEFTKWHYAKRIDRAQLHALWQRFLSSGAQTADPEKADFFFIPVAARSRGLSSPQVLAALQYVQETWPYWNKFGPARHLLIHTADRGVHDLRPEVRNLYGNGTWLTYWGLTKTRPQLRGWEAAHRPMQDVVLPTFFLWSQLSRRAHVESSVLHPRASQTERNITFFFAGRFCGDAQPPSLVPPSCSSKNWQYSAGIRAKVHEHHHFRPGFVLVGHVDNMAQYTARSKFCLAPPGGGFGQRQVLSAFQGCIPVTIGDDIYEPFEPQMDWSQFALRVAEADIPRLHEILAAVTEEQIARLQANLRCAVQHLHWSSINGAFFGETGAYDAFETLMEVLRMKVKYPSATPSQYAQLDADFRDFMTCSIHLSQQGSDSSQLDLSTGAGALGAHVQHSDKLYELSRTKSDVAVVHIADTADEQHGSQRRAASSSPSLPSTASVEDYDVPLRSLLHLPADAESQSHTICSISGLDPEVHQCGRMLALYCAAQAQQSGTTAARAFLDRAGGMICGSAENLAQCPRLWL